MRKKENIGLAGCETKGSYFIIGAAVAAAPVPRGKAGTFVMPAKAGIHVHMKLGPRFRGGDRTGAKFP